MTLPTPKRRDERQRPHFLVPCQHAELWSGPSGVKRLSSVKNTIRMKTSPFVTTEQVQHKRVWLSAGVRPGALEIFYHFKVGSAASSCCSLRTEIIGASRCCSSCVIVEPVCAAMFISLRSRLRRLRRTFRLCSPAKIFSLRITFQTASFPLPTRSAITQEL